MDQKIPKIIHYCWFGGNPKPPLVLKCIDSWKRYCPDYEIIEWNEETFDIHSNAFVEEAYQARKWAFVSDYVRGYALYQYGGIYLDTDMELLQSLDSLLSDQFFIGFEVNDSLAAGVVGCDKENEVIHQYNNYYENIHFSKEGEKGFTTSPIVLTDILRGKGLKLNGKKQALSDCKIYPKVSFYPTDLGWVFGKYRPKTIAVHHYMASWGKNSSLGERSFSSKLRLCVLFHARNLFGTNQMYHLGQMLKKKKRG